MTHSASLSFNFKICVVDLSVVTSARKTTHVQKLHIEDETSYTVNMHD
jgi:hypothetical protein